MSTLCDSFGRQIEYLRLSVTDRCDLRCSYCMPEGRREFEDRANWLTFDEIERVVAAFARLGLHRIRLTGGEPLMRKNLPELAARIASLPGITDLSLSTNGTRLAHHAHALRVAGVRRLNVSLDSLDPARFAAITRRDALAQVLLGLQLASDEGFTPIKINMVVIDGTTDAEIDAMVSFCIAQRYVLRLIEVMPVGATGRDTKTVALGPLQQRLRAQFGLVEGVVQGGGPARYLVSPDGHCQIGFITPISQHFCETCNRVRMSADGVLYLCLGQNDRLDLGAALRLGCNDDDLDGLILGAIRRKPARHDFSGQSVPIARLMSTTGG